jgi:hypothetical protein
MDLFNLYCKSGDNSVKPVTLPQACSGDSVAARLALQQTGGSPANRHEMSFIGNLTSGEPHLQRDENFITPF